MAKMTGRWIQDLTITGGKLANGAVGATQLASAAVNGSKMDLTAAYAFTGVVSSQNTPSSAYHVANKSYVDSVAQGLDIKESCRLATDAALPACTYDGTPNFTLTGDANGALSVDGQAVSVDERILVKNQATGTQNGIYVVTATGDAGNPFILTRADDFNSSEKITSGAFTFVSEGTENATTGWVISTADPITLDTTAIAFTQFSGGGTYSAGDGLDLTGSTFSVDCDDIVGNGLEVSSNDLLVKAYSGATAAIVPANVSADGVGILTDDTTLENNSGTIRVKGAYAHTHTNKANLDEINQDLATTDDVEFNSVSIAGQGTFTYVSSGAGHIALNNVLDAEKLWADELAIGQGSGTDLIVDVSGNIQSCGWVKSNYFTIADGLLNEGNGDTTRRAKFDCQYISTSTTRTFAFPDASGTIALTSDIPAAAAVKKVYLHKITSGEDTAGYFELPEAPAVAAAVTAYAVGGGVQINKAVVGSTGATPDFELLNSDQIHFNNNGSGTGLSEEWTTDDIIQIEYTYTA